jgi:hypothetical protein
MKIEHVKLGSIKVLLEFQLRIDGKDDLDAKYLALAEKRGTFPWNKVSKPLYCMLWSNTPDLHLAGYTELYTDNGNKMTLRGALKHYNKAVKSMPYINLQKI